AAGLARVAGLSRRAPDGRRAGRAGVAGVGGGGLRGGGTGVPGLRERRDRQADVAAGPAVGTHVGDRVATSDAADRDVVTASDVGAEGRVAGIAGVGGGLVAAGPTVATDGRAANVVDRRAGVARHGHGRRARAAVGRALGGTRSSGVPGRAGVAGVAGLGPLVARRRRPLRLRRRGRCRRRG